MNTPSLPTGSLPSSLPSAPGVPGAPGGLPSGGLPGGSSNLLSGVSPMQLPGVGQAQAQLQAAQQLNQMAQNGDVKGLLGAGVTLLSQLASGTGTISKIAQVSTDILGGAAMGFAVGGPMGAFAGAVSGAVEAAFQLGAYQGAAPVDDTAQVDFLYGRLAQWCAIPPGLGAVSGVPSGWALADYSAVTRPPRTTKRPELLFALMQATAVELDAMGSILPNVTEISTSFGGSSGGPSQLYNVTQGGWDAAGFAAQSHSICTPVIWYWGDSTKIQDCILTEWFGWDVPPDQAGDDGVEGSVPPTVGDITTPGTILYALYSDIVAPDDASRQKILKRALHRLPDPLYFCSDLYCQQLNGVTYIFNTAALVALATILGGEQAGMSTMGICAELLQQAQTLAESEGGIPAVFQALLDDYLALAHYEENGHKFPGWGSVVNPAAPPSSGGGGGGSSIPAPASASKDVMTRAAATIQHYLQKYLG